MKLLSISIILCFLLAVNGAVAPGRPLHRGGSSHLSAIRNTARGHSVKNKHHSGSGSESRAGSRNITSNPLHQHHASNEDFHSRYAAATPVAPYRSLNTSSKTHHQRKRSSPISYSRRSESLDASSRTSGSVDSVSRTVSGSSKVDAYVKGSTKTKISKRSPLNVKPTPAPTAKGSPDTTVHINNENDFALLLPRHPRERISDAEADGISFCALGASGCSNYLKKGFITAAAVTRSHDNTSWIQVTGCIDPSQSTLSENDDGGQFDVRFPNGAQCTFGGYGASFIEQVEPSAGRFCLRCCAKENDQTSCNSHQDRSGCITAIPGTYDFPDKGVSCA